MKVTNVVLVKQWATAMSEVNCIIYWTMQSTAVYVNTLKMHHESFK